MSDAEPVTHATPAAKDPLATERRVPLYAKILIALVIGGALGLVINVLNAPQRVSHGKSAGRPAGWLREYRGFVLVAAGVLAVGVAFAARSWFAGDGCRDVGFERGDHREDDRGDRYRQIGAQNPEE